MAPEGRTGRASLRSFPRRTRRRSRWRRPLEQDRERAPRHRTFFPRPNCGHFSCAATNSLFAARGGDKMHAYSPYRSPRSWQRSPSRGRSPTGDEARSPAAVPFSTRFSWMEPQPGAAMPLTHYPPRAAPYQDPSGASPWPSSASAAVSPAGSIRRPLTGTPCSQRRRRHPRRARGPLEAFAVPRHQPGKGRLHPQRQGRLHRRRRSVRRGVLRLLSHRGPAAGSAAAPAPGSHPRGDGRRRAAPRPARRQPHVGLRRLVHVRLPVHPDGQRAARRDQSLRRHGDQP